MSLDRSVARARSASVALAMRSAVALAKVALVMSYISRKLFRESLQRTYDDTSAFHAERLEKSLAKWRFEIIGAPSRGHWDQSPTGSPFWA